VVLASGPVVGSMANLHVSTDSANRHSVLFLVVRDLRYFVATVLWALFIRHKIVIPALAGWGALIVRLKWITCPIAASVLRHRGTNGAAVVALLWPLLMLILPLHLLVGPGRIGEIQGMFMQCLGYKPAR
jgi:hypothetical protein